MGKIVLIRPYPALTDTENFPTDSPPIGLLALSAYLKAHGFEVSVIDLCAEPKTDIKAEIARRTPDVIGITSMTCDFPIALEVADELKTRFTTPIVFGGPHPTIFPKDVLRQESIDYVIVGEGELAFRDLATALRDGKPHCEIDSLGYKEGGALFVNEKRWHVEDMDTLPFPDYSVIDNEKYIDYGEKYLGFRHLVTVISRGCTNRCSFCAQHQVWGNQFRLFSPGKVVPELERLMDEYSVEGFWFKDSVLTIKNWTMAFCEEIMRQKLRMRWSCLARVDQINRELVRTMKKAGLERIWIGAESGSDRVLRLLNKAIKAEQTRQAFRICREEGIDTAAFFMFGLPTETVDEMQSTFEMIRDTNPKPLHLAIYHPLPGTDLYDKYDGAEVIRNAKPREMVFDRACMSTGPVSKELVQEIYDSISAYVSENGPAPDFNAFRKQARLQDRVA